MTNKEYLKKREQMFWLEEKAKELEFELDEIQEVHSKLEKETEEYEKEQRALDE